MRHWRPEPAAEYELRAMETLEFGDFEIYRNKLELVCWEAYQTFSRMGISPMIEAGDAAVGIYTRQGDLAIGARRPSLGHGRPDVAADRIDAEAHRRPTVDGDVAVAQTCDRLHHSIIGESGAAASP